MSFASIDKPNEYFATNAYTGQNGSRDVTDTNNVKFTPDLVWIKHRQDVASHALFDSVRGVGKYLSSNLTSTEATETQSLTAFVSGGFSVGTEPNTPRTDESGGTPNHVAWLWKANGAGVSNNSGTITSTVSANTTSGFSIVSYTGNATAGSTVGHGLGKSPAFIFGKNRTGGTDGWSVYHQSLGGTKAIYLNETGGSTTTSAEWNNTTPSSTVVTLGNGNYVNRSSGSIILYCFAEIKGYSKFGSYTGNGSTDGSFIYTGFTPAFVMVKKSSASGVGWITHDSKRIGFNPNNYYVEPNNSNAESADTDKILLLSNGFKLINTSASWNTSGDTYIYMCFASNPFVSSKGVPVCAR